MKKLLTILLVLIISTISFSKENLPEKIFVTSFYPMYIITKNITKDISGVSVVNMTKPQTGCLHDYAITTDDMKKLEKASVFIINGVGIESFMSKVIKSYPKLVVIEAGKGIETIKTNGEDNPHLWVSISNTILLTKKIAQELVLLDKKNSAKYIENSEIYMKKLSELRGKMHKALDTIPNKNIITFHEAFPYFAKEFNLNVVSVIEREPGSEPSARELAETIKVIKKFKVKAVFAEPQYSSKSAKLIEKETGVKVYTLDPGVSGEDNIDAYLNIMNNNLKVLEVSLK